MSDKENPRDPFNAFGGHPRFPPGLSPPFGWNPPIGNIHPQTAYNLPYQATSAARAPPTSRALQPVPPGLSSGLPYQLPRGPAESGAPVVWMPSPPIRYPSLGCLARSFHEHITHEVHDRPLPPFGPSVNVVAAQDPLLVPPNSMSQPPQQVGFHLQQLINRNQGVSPAPPMAVVRAGQMVASPGTQSSLESLIPTRKGPGRPISCVPEEPANSANEAGDRVVVGEQGTVDTPAMAPNAHLAAPASHPAASRVGKHAAFKFATSGPDMRDLWFIHILSVVNPFDGRGHKTESYSECAKKLKAGPETAILFRDLSDNPTSKTLSNRFNRLKEFLSRDGRLKVVGGTEEDADDLQNRLQMLIRDEEDYLLECGEDARAMEVEASAASSDSDSTVEGDPVPSEGAMEGGERQASSAGRVRSKRARRDAAKEFEEALGKVTVEMRAQNESALKAHREEMAGTHDLFAADLALKEKTFAFNSSVRTRELELAERRLNHEIARDAQADVKIDKLKDHVARVEEVGRAQFEELKGLLLAGRSHPEGSAS